MLSDDGEISGRLAQDGVFIEKDPKTSHLSEVFWISFSNLPFLNNSEQIKMTSVSGAFDEGG